MPPRLIMHKAKQVALKDQTTYDNIRVMDSEESLLLFMVDDDGKEFIRMVPWDNVSYIDYDDPQAVKHIKTIAMMAMLDAMDDVEEFIEEIGDLDGIMPGLADEEVVSDDGDKSELTKNPYGE